MADHELHEHQILKRLESGQRVTQRVIARDLGIALGLTNLLMRRLVNKGWITIQRVETRHIQYLLTPAGVGAKARLTQRYVRESVRFYRETRDRIRDELARLSTEVQDPAGRPPVVFYGAGEVAEIAYICLQETSLDLKALIDPDWSKPFFSTTVCRPTDIEGNTVAGQRFVRLIVMPVDNQEEVHAVLAERGVSPDVVFWL